MTDLNADDLDERPNYLWIRELCCCLESISFPYRGVVFLHVAEGDKTDMVGAIRFARKCAKTMPDFGTVEAVGICWPSRFYMHYQQVTRGDNRLWVAIGKGYRGEPTKIRP